MDETGDRGFSHASSPYFSFAACAFRNSDSTLVIAAMDKLNRALNRPTDRPIHAVRHLKTHEKLMKAVEHLAELQGIVTVSFVVLRKASVPRDAVMRFDNFLVYAHLAEIILKQMSLYARGVGIPAQPIFASVKRMRRESLADYVQDLRQSGSKLFWDALRLPVNVEQADDRVGLQWADIAGRAMLKATTPLRHRPGEVQSIYLETIAPLIWRRQPIDAYGIKAIESGWVESESWWNTVTSRMGCMEQKGAEGRPA